MRKITIQIADDSFDVLAAVDEFRERYAALRENLGHDPQSPQRWHLLGPVGENIGWFKLEVKP